MVREHLRGEGSQGFIRLHYSTMPRALRQSTICWRLFIAGNICIMHNKATDTAMRTLYWQTRSPTECHPQTSMTVPVI